MPIPASRRRSKLCGKQNPRPRCREHRLAPLAGRYSTTCIGEAASRSPLGREAISVASSFSSPNAINICIALLNVNKYFVTHAHGRGCHSVFRNRMLN